MPLEKQLNRAEVLGLTIAQQRVDDALARLQAAEQERDELVRSVGLEPGENYHIAEDGTVCLGVDGIV